MTGSGAAAEQAIAESLMISPRQVRIILGRYEEGEGVEKFWGVDAPDDLAGLNDITSFLQATGLAMAEFDELIYGTYSDEQRENRENKNLFINFPRNRNPIDLGRLGGRITNLTTDRLERIHRLTRVAVRDRSVIFRALSVHWMLQHENVIDSDVLRAVTAFKNPQGARPVG